MQTAVNFMCFRKRKSDSRDVFLYEERRKIAVCKERKREEDDKGKNESRERDKESYV